MSYWIRITRPQEPGIQKELFQASKKVYETLFPSPSEQEPWENFECYLIDTEERRRLGETLDSEDYYYVALYQNNVCGIAYLDIYKEEAIGAISYIGILNQNFYSELPCPPPNIGRDMINDFLGNIIPKLGNEARCQWMLLELEHLRPQFIGSSKNKRELTITDRRQLTRIKWADVLQKKYGAKKIGWIRYHQPKLEWKKYRRKHPMHLMLVSFDPNCEPGISYLSRQEVKSLVKFIYLTWYYEGYECTEVGPNKEQRLKMWELYLSQLYHEAVKEVPKEVKIQSIDLESPRPRLFISYPNNKIYVKISSWAHSYFSEFEFPTFYWPMDKPKLAGQYLDSALVKEMDKSEVFIFFLGNATFSSKGQLKELEYVHKLIREGKNIKVIPLLKGRVRPKRFQKWLPIDPNNNSIIYERYDANSCHSKIEIIATNLLRQEETLEE